MTKTNWDTKFMEDEGLVEEWVDIINEWHKAEPYPPIRPLAEKIRQAITQIRADERERIYDLADGIHLLPENLKEQIESFEKFLAEVDKVKENK